MDCISSYLSHPLDVWPASLSVVEGSVTVAVLSKGQSCGGFSFRPRLTLIAVAGDQTVHSCGSTLLYRYTVPNASYTGKLIDYCLNGQF